MRSITFVYLFILFLPSLTHKILIYQTILGSSHIRFSGKLADVLVDAGYTVDKLLIEWNPFVRTNGTTKATRIRRFGLSKPSPWLSMPHMRDPFKDKVYHLFGHEQLVFQNTVEEFCDAILSDKSVLEWVKEGGYDAAMSSAHDACGFGLFHLAGIKTTFTYSGTPMTDHWTMILGIPNMASYVPSELNFYFSIPRPNFNVLKHNNIELWKLLNKFMC